MCYSHYGNGVRNEVYLVTAKYKVNPIGQRGKILVIVMGFVDKLGQWLANMFHTEVKYRKQNIVFFCYFQAFS